MAYTTDKKSTALDVLTGLDAGDLHIVGDVSDSGRAKAITQNNLEIDIANSTNFVDTLVANNYFTTELAGDTNFITELQTAGISSLDVQENGVSVETPVETINFVAPAGTVTTPSAGVVDVDLSSLIGGVGGGGGTKLAIDTTDTVISGTGLPVTAYTIPIPGGTLGTNDSIRFDVSLSNFSVDNTEHITVDVQYGGTSIGTVVFNGLSDEIPLTSASVRGVLIADGTTNAQKSLVQGISSITFNPNSKPIITVTDTSAEDSTISQDLDIIVTNSGGSSSVTVESIIVEKISSVIDGISIVATANEDLTAGQTVGIGNISGGIARAIRYSDSEELGYTLHNNNLYTNNQTEIGGEKFVVLGYQSSNDSLYASVGTIDRDTLSLSLGTAVAATADIDNPLHCVCKLDTDKFIVFYKEDASTSITKYRVGTVSGSTITFGSAATFYDNADTITGIRCVQIGTDKGVVFIVANTTTATRVLAFTVSGTTATIGTDVTPDANVRVESAIQKVDTDKFIIASAAGYSQVGTISGTTITLGSAVQYTASSVASDGKIEIASPATNVAVIRFTITSTETLIACTISGTVPTFGTQVSGSTTTHGLIATDANTLLTVSNGRIYKYTLTGTVLTFKNSVMYQSGTLEVIINMANGYFIAMNGTTTGVNILIEGMSNGFIGIVQDTASRGSVVNVLTSGVDSNQVDLVPGTYYEPISGGLSSIPSSDTAYTSKIIAISDTEVSI